MTTRAAAPSRRPGAGGAAGAAEAAEAAEAAKVAEVAQASGSGPGTPDGADPVEPSAAYLLARVALLEGRVRALVSHRRRDDPTPDDPFRGLYLSDEHVDAMLAHAAASRVIDWDDGTAVDAMEDEARVMETDGVDIRLRSLARRAGLDTHDVDILVIALAPDLDARFERLYGYLNDDVTRRRATIGLSLELAGLSPWSADGRARLLTAAPLASGGLIFVEDPDRPFLSRSIRVPDRVAGHLLGDDRPDPAVADMLHGPAPLAGSPLVDAIGRAIGAGVRLVYLHEKAGASGAALAVSALASAGRAAVAVDLDHAGAVEELTRTASLAAREALLTSGGVVAGPVDSVLPGGLAVVTALAGLASADRAGAGSPVVVLHGRAGWDPAWSKVVPLVISAGAATRAERLGQWEATLAADAPADLVSSDVTTQFLLSSDQVARAVEAARLQAGLANQPVSVGDLRAGARSQNGAGLAKLARRVEPGVGWDDLVLAPATADSLRALAGRARRRDQVLDEWGMRPGGGRGRGITVLFAGDSGTGKTMSAEVVAGDLGLDLYTVNLATVVDKYVGETEKNLERIFSEADGVNAVLLFDEADALFGKRSEVRDANDRYANIEVAYLLQRMETFDGIAILATNLRANVDDAFARRLDMIVDFPTPDVELRRALWDRCLALGVPRGNDLDLDFCAKSFELSGGNIRSIAITAAYLAADSGRPVDMEVLVRSVQQEYRKLGRLVVPGEFGPYYSMIGA